MPVTQMIKNGEFNPDWRSPPADTIRDILEQQFGDRVGLSRENLEKLMNGELAIDGDLAEKLSMTLGGSVSFWIKRDQQYREKGNRNGQN